MKPKFTPLFSIIVPLYKKYQCFYSKLIHSILSQTSKDFECIFVYYDLFFDFLKGDHFVYIKSKSDDVCSKRNMGIKHAKGKYLIFCDADDYISFALIDVYKTIVQKYEPDYICMLCTRNEADLDNSGFYQKHEFINNKNIIDDYIFGRYLKTQKVGKHPFIFSNINGKAFKKELIVNNEIMFHEPPFRAEDMVFANDFMIHAKNMIFLYKNLYYWRINTTSVMYDTSSFFTNINPFIEYFINQMSKVDPIYSRDLNYYLSKIIINTIHNLYFSLITRKISRKTFLLKLTPIIDTSSISFEILKQKSQLKGPRKVYRWFIITHQMYFIKLIEYVYVLKNKLKGKSNLKNVKH